MPQEIPVKYWSMGAADVLGALNSTEKGITSAEGERRHIGKVKNEISGNGYGGALRILISQFKSPLILILVAAAIVSFFLGEQVNSAVIIVIVLVNSLLGFYQEYKADRALRELAKYVTMKCKVMRDGQIVELDSRSIVEGDIVYLDLGDIVPADIRLLKSDGLWADESALTGESLPLPKTTVPIAPEASSPHELVNMCFMGTSISAGSGYGVVCTIGKGTFYGKAASKLDGAEPQSAFQKNIAGFGNFLLIIVTIMTLFVFAANFILGRGVLDSFLFAVALAVGITPEILPVIITISLSHGARRMAKENVIIKRLSSVEDLGNIDTLCCDKTGTLTEGKITLEKCINAQGAQDDSLILYGLLCNTSHLGPSNKALGNQVDKAITESALAQVALAQKAGYTVVDFNEYDFERRRMSVLVRGSLGLTLMVKGAPESVFSVCTKAMDGKRALLITPEKKAALESLVLGLETAGYSVIAVAGREMDRENSSKSDETALTLAGFLLFSDPAKKSVAETLQMLRKLNVNVKVISGDSPHITRKICNDVGFEIMESHVVVGSDIEKVDEKELEFMCTRYNVFARMTPSQKHRVVTALSKEGHVVGYMGDGINDVAALKAADVGISVDSATGIAKEAADVILLNKSLRVVVHGIREGRKTFTNITKYILNTVSANYGNMFTVAFSSLFLPFFPLLPVQILLNNFISDFPLLTISTDNVEEQLLRKPKKWHMGLISNFMIYFGLLSTFFDLLLIVPLLAVFHVAPEMFRTAWFVESAISEILVLFAIRTSLPLVKSVPSKMLLITSILTAAFVLVISFSSIGSVLFGFVGLPVPILAFIFVVLALYFLAAEAAKHYFYSKFEI